MNLPTALIALLRAPVIPTHATSLNAASSRYIDRSGRQALYW